ncbi:MAG: DUF4338 domain-containing protein [Candidatus Pacebacteria bacterium]|jgi:hypothetical protein|nr:DUF4338 domain-containing protein [Candidatus Paceibacterota bacterium]
MVKIIEKELKQKVISILIKQGYIVKSNGFVLKDDSREVKRDAHVFAKAERINKNEKFITDNIDLISHYMVDGKKLDIKKIDPQIIEVKTGSKYEKIFRWWNLVWWSLPYERAYGRQMRFIVWDRFHKAPIGLIGLQSPILSWSIRDSYLGITKEKRDYWVNQSLSAQRLGALPPYNYILGGKLVASLMTASVIRKKFEKKYKNQKTIIKKRKLPSRLLFITTTGAYGKSSVYNRLKFNDEHISKFIGYTHGSGSFHIPNNIYEDFLIYLRDKNYDVKRGYGTGPSRKLRLINQAMECLGISNGTNHGIKRAIYLFPLTENLKAVISENKKPTWFNRNIEDLTLFWQERWAIPRAKKNKEYLDFNADKFLEDTAKEIEKYKKLYSSTK